MNKHFFAFFSVVNNKKCSDSKNYSLKNHIEICDNIILLFVQIIKYLIYVIIKLCNLIKLSK